MANELFLSGVGWALSWWIGPAREVFFFSLTPKTLRTETAWNRNRRATRNLIIIFQPLEEISTINFTPSFVHCCSPKWFSICCHYCFLCRFSGSETRRRNRLRSELSLVGVLVEWFVKDSHWERFLVVSRNLLQSESFFSRVSSSTLPPAKKCDHHANWAHLPQATNTNHRADRLFLTILTFACRSSFALNSIKCHFFLLIKRNFTFSPISPRRQTSGKDREKAQKAIIITLKWVICVLISIPTLFFAYGISVVREKQSHKTPHFEARCN